MRKAWVLSGGGAKGGFQVGVMKRLLETESAPDHIFGTSVGAINAFALSAFGISDTEKFWLEINSRRHVLGPEWLKLFWAKGIFNLNPLKKRLMRAEKKVFDIPFSVAFTDISTGEVRYASNLAAPSVKAMVDLVLASSAIPFAMAPIRGTLFDGGIREQVPLKKCLEFGPWDEVTIILCNPPRALPIEQNSFGFPKALTLGLRALDVMEHEVFLNDFKICGGAKFRIFAPDEYLHGTLEFKRDKIKKAIDLGYSAKEINNA